MAKGFRAFAPAKINLFLHVGPPRADGMHPLESLVVFADVGDWLIVSPSETLTLALEGPFAPALADDPAENLVLRAARALAAEAGRAPQARVLLDKRLPIASGIGGGSSDAAAALRALDALWECRAAPEDLARIAGRLGADVPVCLAARPALMSGLGERVAPCPAPDLHALLVNPGVPAPTGAVYRAFDRLGGGGAFAEEGASIDLHDPIAALRARRNDLTEAAIAVAPEIRDALDGLERLEGARLARLSGSGATAFALFGSAAEAEAARHALRAPPQWWTATARLGAVDARPEPL